MPFLTIFLGGLATALLEPFAELLGLAWIPVNRRRYWAVSAAMLLRAR